MQPRSKTQLIYKVNAKAKIQSDIPEVLQSYRQSDIPEVIQSCRQLDSLG